MIAMRCPLARLFPNDFVESDEVLTSTRLYKLCLRYSNLHVMKTPADNPIWESTKAEIFNEVAFLRAIKTPFRMTPVKLVNHPAVFPTLRVKSFKDCAYYLGDVPHAYVQFDKASGQMQVHGYDDLPFHLKQKFDELFVPFESYNFTMQLLKKYIRDQEQARLNRAMRSSLATF